MDLFILHVGTKRSANANTKSIARRLLLLESEFCEFPLPVDIRSGETLRHESEKGLFTFGKAPKLHRSFANHCAHRRLMGGKELGDDPGFGIQELVGLTRGRNR